ncbi:MAG: hypothetical protein LBH79_01340 [Nitrososphaerota archaeon]|jgi:hypothetical protein|nr:hypothetical protein [Nitrososphaerota archaeon]
MSREPVRSASTVNKPSHLEIFIKAQKELVESFQDEPYINPSISLKENIAKAEKSIKKSQEIIKNIRQMQQSGTLNSLFEQDLQKLSPQQRKEAEEFLQVENRIKLWEEWIKYDERTIKTARAQIKQTQKNNPNISPAGRIKKAVTSMNWKASALSGVNVLYREAKGLTEKVSVRLQRTLLQMENKIRSQNLGKNYTPNR